MGKAADVSGIGQGHVFHTVMGLLALSAGPYRRELDMFSALK